jgi:hypothetical protein
MEASAVRWPRRPDAPRAAPGSAEPYLFDFSTYADALKADFICKRVFKSSFRETLGHLKARSLRSKQRSLRRRRLRSTSANSTMDTTATSDLVWTGRWRSLAKSLPNQLCRICRLDDALEEHVFHEDLGRRTERAAHTINWHHPLLEKGPILSRYFRWS